MKKITATTFLLAFCMIANAQLQYDWHHELGGTVTNRQTLVSKVCVDTANNVYICGSSKGDVDYDFGPAVAYLADTAYTNGFVVVYDTDGNYLRSWTIVTISTPGQSRLTDMCIAENGDVLVTGYYEGTIDLDPSGAVISASATNGGTFAARYTGMGQLLWYVNYNYTSTSSVEITCIDEEDDIIVIGGSFAGTTAVDLNTGAGSEMYVPDPYNSNGFIVRLNAAGNYNSSVGYIGNVNNIAINGNGRIAVTGVTVGLTDFNPGFPTANYSAIYNSPPLGDFFVASYDSMLTYQWHQASGSSFYPNYGIDVRIGAGNVVVVNGSSGNGGTFTSRYYQTGALAWSRPAGSAIDVDVQGNVCIVTGTGTFSVSPMNVLYWGSSVLAFQSTACVAVTSNSKIVFSWLPASSQDVDPGSGTILVNSPAVYNSDKLLSLHGDLAGVNGNVLQPTIRLFPNPCTDYLAVEAPYGEESYTILNAAGQAVRTFVCTGNCTVSVAELAPGEYFLQRQSDGGMSRFVIAR